MKYVDHLERIWEHGLKSPQHQTGCRNSFSVLHSNHTSYTDATEFQQRTKGSKPGPRWLRAGCHKREAEPERAKRKFLLCHAPQLKHKENRRAAAIPLPGPSAPLTSPKKSNNCRICRADRRTSGGRGVSPLAAGSSSRS